MKKTRRLKKTTAYLGTLLLAALFALAGPGYFPAQARQESNKHSRRPQTAAGQVVFKLKAPAKAGDGKFRQKYFFKESHSLGSVHRGKEIFRAVLADDDKVADAVRRLRADSAVEWAEPVYYRYSCEDPVVPNDPDYAYQAYLNVMGFPLAWDISTGDHGVVVALIDTGLDLAHPDLAANIWTNSGELAGNGVDDDGNGYIDDVQGWDFVSVPVSTVAAGEDAGPPDNDPSDVHGHGTHVAGTIGAGGDNSLYGVGGSWQVSLMPLRAGYKDKNGQGVLTTVDIAAALYYACDNGADIVNMSFGGDLPGEVERDAIEYCAERNILLVAAAGNDGGSEPVYPAAFAPVFAVASVGANKKISTTSSYGVWVDAAACGENIYSTLPLAQGGFGVMSGTSMAAALVSAQAVLLKAVYPGWTAAEVAERIRSTAVNINPLNPDYNNQLGAGLIDSWRAVNGTQQLLRYPGLVSLEVREDQEPDDHYLDPDEIFSLYPLIRNFGLPLNDVSLVLTTSDPYIAIQDSSVHLGGLFHDQRLAAADDFFKVKVAWNAPVNHQAQLSCRVYQGSSLVADEPLKLQLNPFMRNRVVVALGSDDSGYMAGRIIRDEGNNNLTMFYRSTGMVKEVVARHRDSAGNWREPQAVEGMDYAAALGAAPDIHVVYANSGSLNYRLYDYQANAWSGATDLTSDGFDSNSDRLAVASDEQDNPHVAWTDNLTLYYRYFDGSGWSAPLFIADLEKNIDDLNLFLVDGGLPLLLWRQTNDIGGFTPCQINMLRRHGGGEWGNIALVAPQITSQGFSAALDSALRLHLSYDSTGGSIDYTVFSDNYWRPSASVYCDCKVIKKNLLAPLADEPHIIRCSKTNWGDAEPLLYGLYYESEPVNDWSPFVPIAHQTELVQLEEKDFKIGGGGEYLLSGSSLDNNSILFYSSEINEDFYPSRPVVRAGAVASPDAGEVAVTLASSHPDGIAAYRLALGTAPGSDDILPWYQAGGEVTGDGFLAATVPLGCVILQPGRRCYVSAQAVGLNGYWSPVGSSPGVFCYSGSVFDGDNDVDGLDLAAFAAALAGGVGNAADINGNGVVDGYDFADFVRVFALTD